MKSTVFWDARHIDVFWRFGGTYGFYFHGRKLGQATNQLAMLGAPFGVEDGGCTSVDLALQLRRYCFCVDLHGHVKEGLLETTLELFKNIGAGARGTVVGWGTILQAGRSWVRFLMRSLYFSIDLILPAALWSWDRLSLWQKWVPGIFLGGDGRPARKADSLTAVCEPIF
jgi:hypothetical protein